MNFMHICEIKKSISWISIVYDVFWKRNRKREHVFSYLYTKLRYTVLLNLPFIIRHTKFSVTSNEFHETTVISTGISFKCHFFYYFAGIVWCLFSKKSLLSAMFSWVCVCVCVCVHAYIYISVYCLVRIKWYFGCECT